MDGERKPSEIIQEFLDWLKQCQEEYETAKLIVDEEDLKKQDYLHALEFECDTDRIVMIAKELHESRVNRRKNKDIMWKLDKVAQFTYSERFKQSLRGFKTLVGEQKVEEEKMECVRVYTPRSEATRHLFEDQKEGEPNVADVD